MIYFLDSNSVLDMTLKGLFFVPKFRKERLFMADEPNVDPTQSTEPENNSNSDSSSDSNTEVIESARQSAINDLLNTLGINSTDELKIVVQAQNEAIKANQTDLENAQTDLKKANESNTELTSRVASLEASNAVLKAGVTPEHVADATILVQARVSNGQAKDIDKTIKDVLKTNPQFTGDVATGKDGTAIIKENVGGNSEHKKTSMGDMIAKLNAGRIIKCR